MNYYTDVLKKYATFSGRARRKEYWMFVLWNFIIGLVLNVLSSVFVKAGIAPLTLLLYGVTILYYLAVVIPSLAVLVRRLHDTGRSGWWVLIGLVPIIGGIVLIIFAVMDGQPGDNAYGSNPKQVAA